MTTEWIEQGQGLQHSYDSLGQHELIARVADEWFDIITTEERGYKWAENALSNVMDTLIYETYEPGTVDGWECYQAGLVSALNRADRHFEKQFEKGLT